MRAGGRAGERASETKVVATTKSMADAPCSCNQRDAYILVTFVLLQVPIIGLYSFLCRRRHRNPAAVVSPVAITAFGSREKSARESGIVSI